MSNHISVVTSCTNGRDALCDEQVTEGAAFIAYVDREFHSRTWEEHKACELFVSPRRNSRIHKLLIHQYADSAYSLWIDANIRLLVPAEQVIEEWLAHHDIAMFRHRVRNCPYDEAELCAQLQLDDPALIREQAAHYRAQGFPANGGLGEACVVARRHNRATERFNNAWWAEYTRFSVRDQISVMVAAAKASTPINLITPTRFEHPYFASEMRAPGLELKVDLPPDVLSIA